jgi:UDP-N-acetylmuramoyl-tripeptide--D-alanyl-D-alanine ligase
VTPLWTSSDVVQATGGASTVECDILGVSIDTRTVQRGDLFVALTDTRDGHDFVAQAFERGAVAALVSRVPKGVEADAPLILVDDVLTALQNLGRAARARMSGQVIGVTGSVGKTSTKDMLQVILQGQGAVHASIASYNNHWGVPLTLARMPKDTDFAVIEIGMSQPGEIAPLSKLARPDVAMITTVAPAHMAAFSSVDAIAIKKAAIFKGLGVNGVAVIHGDVPQAHLLRKAWTGETIAFGVTERTDAQLRSVSVIDTVTVGEARIDGIDHLFRLNAAGSHFATNAVGCLAVVQALGADVTLAARALSQWVPRAGRCARETILLDPVEIDQTLELIDDAFNANPSSVTASLEVLASAKVTDGIGRVMRGRRVAFLGDMLELGSNELAEHAALADVPWLAGIDVVHCVGSRMLALYTVLPLQKRGRWFETAGDAFPQLRHLVDAGDVVLLKGSKGSNISQLVDGIRNLGHPQQEL